MKSVAAGVPEQEGKSSSSSYVTPSDVHPVFARTQDIGRKSFHPLRSCAIPEVSEAMNRPWSRCPALSQKRATFRYVASCYRQRWQNLEFRSDLHDPLHLGFGSSQWTAAHLFSLSTVMSDVGSERVHALATDRVRFILRRN